MGALHYGSDFHVNADDRSLTHLDAILSRLHGAHFQLHVIGLDGPQDGNIASLAIGTAPLRLEFFNDPDIKIEFEVIMRGMLDVQDYARLTFPFSFSDESPGGIDRP